MRKARFWCAIMVGLFFSIAAGYGKDIYVRDGSKGDGSKASPYGNVEDALQSAYAGDVIHVAQGVYYGSGAGGLFTIKVQNLTMVGGYDKNFANRNPFQNRTILMRGVGVDDSLTECKNRGHDKWHSLTPTKASYNTKGVVEGSNEPREDHTGFILDGFYIDGHTRNTYKANGDLNLGVGPIGTPLIDLNREGCKVRNCVVINSAGPGIRLRGYGKKDKPETWPEVSNCFIINTLMKAMDFLVGDFDPSNNPDSGYALIKNNTVAFIWEHLGEGYGLLVGRQTKLTVEKNLFTFSSYCAINNGYMNSYVRLIDNVFWNNMEGQYKYWDPNSKLTLIEDAVENLGSADANKAKMASKKYSISKQSQGNKAADPKLGKIDKDFFEKFSNQIKSTGGGKVEWDSVNQWRSMMGLPLIGSSGTGVKNYAPIYEIDFAVLTPGDSALKGYGVNLEGPFESYSSANEAAAKDYQAVSLDDLVNSSALDGKDVMFTVNIGDRKMGSYFYVQSKATDKTHLCFEVGKYPNSTFIYVPLGSEALEAVNEGQKLKQAVSISGTAYSIKEGYKKDRVAVVVDSAEIESED